MNNNTLFSPASSPEELGISSRAIMDFLERIENKRICMHGFLLLRHGQIAAEGYWDPFSVNSMHRMYSVSKSFVSLAIGLMVDEGKIKLDDNIIDYFPDKLPENVHPYLKQTTIRDLLMMATPQNSTTYSAEDSDWAWTFFNTTPNHPPGTIFSYDTSATVVLNTIVERISEKPFLEYIRPHILDPVGFTEDAWCIKTPEGSSWGGSGVICKLRDMAKLAYVCMNKGRWQDQQLISESYITAATSRQIDNSLNGHPGYGYQIWRLKENGFAFRGMGGQFAFCFPDQNFLFASIADMQGDDEAKREMIQAFWQELYYNLEDTNLPEDPENNSLLKEKISNLKILPQQGKKSSDIINKINGVWYELNENPMGISRMRLTFEDKEGVWEYTNAQGDNRLKFGIGQMLSGKFPQENYYGDKIGSIPGTKYDCLASAAWVEEHKLNMLIYIIDNHLGNLKITFSFKDDQISIYMTKAAEWFLEEYQGFAGGKIQQ
ncbi:MAG: serine hydrolase domain-containing protein [Bacillota bacterium]